ncbi:MAG: tetratricopeptide repeat protein [Acidimicrobiia bacterium]
MSTATLPTGTVTFLFTDIEGSTKLLQQLGERYETLLEDHCRILRRAIAAGDGVEVSTEGDAFFAVFPSAPQALAAVVAAQRELNAHDWPDGSRVLVRMGLHTGEGILGGDNYLGLDVHRAARIASAGHGGQVLVSAATRALVEGSLAPGVGLRDLGAHRLKDLARPEQLSQLTVEGLPGDFPQLRTLEVSPNNLPVQRTSFVAREREVTEAAKLLEGTRLLTLTGPGGTGKTRLSLQVAAEGVERFPDGVYFVPLASLTDPDLVPSAILTQLELHQASGPPLDALSAYLADKRMLLVLDNFEQILPAAVQVAGLLDRAQDLKVLVTSRAPLRIYGEQEFPVPPLGVPDPRRLLPLETLAEHGAVALFVERARAAQPAFSLTEENAPAVAEISARLDGLPLAIELAAARVKLLPPQTMVSRMEQRLGLLAGGSRDLPTRQQTLRDAIAWSYDLLDEPGKRLLHRMAVFVGGAALDQAELVCGPPEELGADVLDGLGLLVDQSLLRQEAEGEPRFLILETIREFALERLEEAGEASAIQERHAGAFLALAEEAEPHLTHREQATWLDRLELDHDNLRAALAWAAREHDAEFALRLAGAVWRFWQIRGHIHEARQRFDAILAMPGDHPQARAKALEGAGGLAYWQNDMDAALGFYQECLDIWRELGDQPGVAYALYNLSFPSGMRADPDYQRAQELLDEALEIVRRLGDRLGIGKVLWGMGVLANWPEDWDQARALGLESLEHFRSLDAPFDLGWALYMLGNVEFKTGNSTEALPYLEEGLKLFAQVRDLSGVVLHLGSLAAVELAQGEVERGVRLAGAMAAQRKLSGTQLVDFTVTQVAGLGQALAELEHDRTEALLAEGQAMTLEEAVDYALRR